MPAILLRILLVIGAVTISHVAIAQPIALDVLFKKAQFGGAVLSPGGRYLAVLTPVNDRQNLAGSCIPARATASARPRT